MTSARLASATPTVLPAVIFDLDGTLVDSERTHHEAARRLLGEHGLRDDAWGRHARPAGMGIRGRLESLREEYRISTPVEELLDRKNTIYLELTRERCDAYPEMRAFAELLRVHGHPLAVVSGCSRRVIERVLESAGLGKLFAVHVSAEEVTAGKPEPGVLLEAARRLAVAPADCAVVGDTTPVARAAQRAGMRCVAVPYAAKEARDPAFAAVGLLFTGGHREFDARVAYEWITRG